MDDESSPAPVPSTVSVTGTGRASRPPDMVEISVGINVLRPTVAEATAEATAVATALLAAVRAQGVGDGDLQTTNYSVNADYDHRSQPPRLLGYRVDNSLTVTVRTLDDFPAVLAAATEAGGDATTIGGIGFGHSDPAVLIVECRELAWNEAVAAASQLADLADRRLGPARRIVEGGSGIPRPQPMARVAMMDAAAVPIEGGTVSREVTVKVEFELS